MKSKGKNSVEESAKLWIEVSLLVLASFFRRSNWSVCSSFSNMKIEGMLKKKEVSGYSGSDSLCSFSHFETVLYIECVLTLITGIFTFVSFIIITSLNSGIGAHSTDDQ